MTSVLLAIERIEMTSVLLWDTEPMKVTRDGRKLWWDYQLNMRFEGLALDDPFFAGRYVYFCEMPHGDRMQVILREDFRNPDRIW